MSARERVRATSPIYRSEGGSSGGRASVPRAAREHLGARVGDTLVFEEGCAATVERAALRGRYFVVTVERAGESRHVPAPPAAVATGESFEDSVKKYFERKDEERALNS